MLHGFMVPCHDGDRLHVEAATLQCLYCRFGIGMAMPDRMQKLYITFPDRVMSGFVLTLLMGFMTRISAVLVALFLGMYGASGGFAGGPLEAATIAHSLALALLGPGAYSIDSRLFGRRRVIFESRKLDGED